MLLSLRVHPDQSESVVAGLVCVGVDCCPDLVTEVKKFLFTSRLGQLAIAVGIVAPGTSENPKTRCIRADEFFRGIFAPNSIIEFDPHRDSIPIFGSLQYRFTTTREL